MIGLRKALKKVLGRAPASVGPAQPVEPASPPARPSAAGTEAGPAKPAEGDLPWYLQGDRDEGWDATNPGTEPGKKNLVEK